jgi:DNA mismatch repair protein MLH1
VENALDAHSTEVTVTIRNGGLDLIKVKDNGSGINQEDYPLVCQRFATSKLKSVSDLQSISTFGFRGEALASISCMSEVKVTSHTKNSPLAWTVNYKSKSSVILQNNLAM